VKDGVFLSHAHRNELAIMLLKARKAVFEVFALWFVACLSLTNAGVSKPTFSFQA